MRLDLAAGHESGIDQIHRPQPFQRIRIGIEMLRLAAHRALIGDAQPGEIVENGALEFGCATH